MHRKHKIVHVTSSLKIGGAEAVLYELITNLPEFEHTIIYFHDGPYRALLQAQGITLYPVKNYLVRYDPLFLYALYTLLRGLRPTIIHSLLWAANTCCRFLASVLNIPLVSAIHLGPEQDGYIRNSIDRLTYSLSQQTIAVSPDIATTLVQKNWVIPSAITIIPNGISYQSVIHKSKQASLLRVHLEINAQHFVIGTVGRLIKRKNHTLLLESFAAFKTKVPQSTLIIVGSGPEETLLRAHAQALGIRSDVRFITQALAYGYYTLFDCFALPSYQEGLSIALLEALCFSLPCIVTSSTQAHPCITSYYNGIVIPTGNAHALTEALFTLAHNPDQAQKLGSNGFKTLRAHYTASTMAQAYKKTFERLIKV